ncbi:MAG: hypothetical protein LKJ93_02870, partial [Bacteroidales bacterium]|nr:hypothetical protein [Bacteroidales bacterium]
MKRFSLALSLILAFPLISYAQTGKILGKFNTPGDFPTGVCYDGKYLWQADRGTDKIYCTDANTGKVVKTIESPAYWPAGLTWDGKYLWNADFRGRTDISEERDGMIFQIDPADGTIVKTLRAPGSSPKGLAWDGKYLWMVDDVQDKVIQFSSSDGTAINSFKSPAKNPKGITFDGKYLWISDSGTDEIYMVDPKTGYVIIIMDAPGNCVYGITVSGDSLWAADYNDDMICKLKIRDRTPFIRKDRQTHKVTYHHAVTCFGPGKIKTLDVNIALPENRVNQEIIGKIRYNIKPSEFPTDQWGQKTALFEFKDIKPGEKTDIEVTTTVNTYDVRYFIYPEFVGSLSDIPRDIKDKYLADDDKYQINSETVRKAKDEALGGETNPYWIMRKLHQYLITHLYYNMDGEWDTAPTVLRNGSGSCSEYTFVYIALCRAAGLPARYVGSTWCHENNAYMDEVYHRWVEVYLPGYGWVPTDPTHGDRELPRDQAFPIGYVSNAA